MPQAICRSSIEGCSKSSKLKAHDHLIFLWPPLTNRYPELILLGDCGPVLQDGGLSDGAAPDQGEDQEEDQAPQVLSYLIHSSYIYLIKGTRRRLWRSSAWRERLCCQASSWRRQTQLRWGVFTTLSLSMMLFIIFLITKMLQSHCGIDIIMFLSRTRWLFLIEIFY
mgnify:CR=1 FL=1